MRGKKRHLLGVVSFFYASNEPKSVLAQDLGDCRDNLRNSRSVFLIVYLKMKIAGSHSAQKIKKVQLWRH